MSPDKNMNVTEAAIDLAIAFDQNYLVPAYALLASIFSNNIGTRFRFHVIATGISAREEQEIIRYVTDNNSTITFYKIAPEYVQGLIIQKNRHLTVAAYYRLFFPQLVPADVKTLLYLDTDLVVNGNLRELCTLEMGTFPVAAVRRTNGPARPELGIYERGANFNSGVMLMNLPEWKRQKITEKSLEFIKDFPEPEKIVLADQDALNAVLKNNYYSLDPKYNIGFYELPKNATAKQYRAFAKDKVIIHYTSVHKPWNPLSKNRLGFLYFQYLKRAPKTKSKMVSNFHPTLKNLIKFIKIRLKEGICDLSPLLARRLSKTYLWKFMD